MSFTPEQLDQLSALVQMAVGATAQGLRQPVTDKKVGRVDERYLRNISVFKGDNFKDFSFQLKSAARGSSELAYKLLNLAEKEEKEIDDVLGFHGFEESDEDVRKNSSELFNLIITMVQGEALQSLHNCNFSGAEAWRRLTRRYSPSTPLRAMQLMLQVVNPGQAKNPKDIQHRIDKWESQVLALERDFKEHISSKMKAAIIISMLPNYLRDALIQQADRFEEYQPAKEKIISIVEAKMAMRSPDEMDVDNIGDGRACAECDPVDAMGKGGSFATGVEDRAILLQSAQPQIRARVKLKVVLVPKHFLAKVAAREAKAATEVASPVVRVNG